MKRFICVACSQVFKVRYFEGDSDLLGGIIKDEPQAGIYKTKCCPSCGRKAMLKVVGLDEKS